MNTQETTTLNLWLNLSISFFQNHFRANKALELIKAAEKGDLDTVKR